MAPHKVRERNYPVTAMDEPKSLSYFWAQNPFTLTTKWEEPQRASHSSGL